MKNKVLDPDLGSWLGRDPIGYAIRFMLLCFGTTLIGGCSSAPVRVQDDREVVWADAHYITQEHRELIANGDPDVVYIIPVGLRIADSGRLDGTNVWNAWIDVCIVSRRDICYDTNREISYLSRREQIEHVFHLTTDGDRVELVHVPVPKPMPIKMGTGHPISPESHTEFPVGYTRSESSGEPRVAAIYSYPVCISDKWLLAAGRPFVVHVTLAGWMWETHYANDYTIQSYPREVVLKDVLLVGR